MGVRELIHKARPAWPLMLAWSYTVAVAVLAFALFDGAAATHGSGRVLPLYAFSAAGAYLASRRSTGRDRFGWLAIGAAWLTSFFGAAAWAFEPPAPLRPAFETAGGVLYNLYYAFMAAGLLALARKPVRGTRAQVVATEVLIVWAATRVLADHFLEPASGPSALSVLFGQLSLTSLGEPLVLVTAVVALSRPVAGPARWSLQALALAALVATLGDLLFDASALASPQWRRPLSDALVAVSAALVGTAGYAWRPEPDRSREHTLPPLLPYVAVGVVALLTVAVVVERGVASSSLGRLAIGLAVLSFLLLVRAALWQRELTAEAAARRLQEAQLRQSQKLDAIGLLAGGIAHDFNNLLAAIGMTVDYLKTRGRHEDAADFDEVNATVERGAGLCRQLLAFGRLDQPEQAPVILSDVTAHVKRLIRRLLPSSVSVQVVSEGPPACTVGDRVQLEVALLNLAVNARDAMPSGGTLTLTTSVLQTLAGDEWNLAGVPPGEWAVVSVSDTGTGMTSEVRSRVFEPFFTTKGVGQGTGLGLSMVHGVVASCGGHIRLRSTVGQGTRFDLCFPLTRRPARTEVAVVQPKRGDGARVMVVDDEPLLRRSLIRQLSELGYEALEAGDGVDALEQLQAGKPIELLVTDFTMPKMNGAELIRRARERVPGLPAVCITGRVSEPGLSALPADVVVLGKPFGLAELSQALKRPPAAPA